MQGSGLYGVSTKSYQPAQRRNYSHLALLVWELNFLILLISWRFLTCPQLVLVVLGFSVRVLWFWMRCLWSDQLEFMTLIMVSRVLICGASRNDMMWVLWSFLILSIAFSCYNAQTDPVLRSSSKLVEFFCCTQWLRIARSKGSNILGVSCLKTEAEPASEM